MRITRVYTKQGDKGETQLVGGKRVPKDSPRIAATGEVDELNSLIGLVRASFPIYRFGAGTVPMGWNDINTPSKPPVGSRRGSRVFVPDWVHRADSLLARIQNDLFIVGADLASPANMKVPRIAKRHVTALEKAIDAYLEELEPLKEFILPGGSQPGALLHLARAVCRRAERLVVMLSHMEKINPQLIVYLNRLSDFLFVAGRIVNKHLGAAEQSVNFRA